MSRAGILEGNETVGLEGEPICVPAKEKEGVGTCVHERGIIQWRDLRDLLSRTGLSNDQSIDSMTKDATWERSKLGQIIDAASVLQKLDETIPATEVRERLLRNLEREADCVPEHRHPILVGDDLWLIEQMATGAQAKVFSGIFGPRSKGGSVEQAPRLCVYKWFHENHLDEARQRNSLEADVSRRLTVTGIVPQYIGPRYDEKDGKTVIGFLSQYIHGSHTLLEVSRTMGAAKRPEVVAHLLRHLARDLEICHAAGIIHRDLKPGNVLVTPEGDCKLLDFGIARMTSQPHLTSQGSVLGTLGYMPPEQLQCKEVAEPADVYALGIIGIQLWTGSMPFPSEIGDNALLGDAVERLVEERTNLHWFEKMQEQLPNSLAPLLQQCVDPDPKKRPQASQVRETIEKVFGVLSVEPIFLRHYLQSVPPEALVRAIQAAADKATQWRVEQPRREVRRAVWQRFAWPAALTTALGAAAIANLRHSPQTDSGFAPAATAGNVPAGNVESVDRAALLAPVRLPFGGCIKWEGLTQEGSDGPLCTGMEIICTRDGQERTLRYSVNAHYESGGFKVVQVEMPSDEYGGFFHYALKGTSVKPTYPHVCVHAAYRAGGSLGAIIGLNTGVRIFDRESGAIIAHFPPIPGETPDPQAEQLKRKFFGSDDWPEMPVYRLVGSLAENDSERRRQWDILKFTASLFDRKSQPPAAPSPAMRASVGMQ